ncbi:MAG: TerD family protein [Patescibacteria group bacterium]
MPLAVIQKSAGVGLNVQQKPNLSKLIIKAGWDEVSKTSSKSGGLLSRIFGDDEQPREKIDVDIFATTWQGTRKIDCAYYSNKSIHGGSITHGGDNVTGADSIKAERIPSEGLGFAKSMLAVDEFIQVDLSRLPSNIDRVTISINIYNAERRNQTFDGIENCFMAIADGANQNQYLVSMANKTGTGFLSASITRDGNDWRIVNHDEPINGSIDTINSKMTRFF